MIDQAGVIYVSTVKRILDVVNSVNSMIRAHTMSAVRLWQIGLPIKKERISVITLCQEAHLNQKLTGHRTQKGLLKISSANRGRISERLLVRIAPSGDTWDTVLTYQHIGFSG